MSVTPTVYEAVTRAWRDPTKRRNAGIAVGLVAASVLNDQLLRALGV